MTGAQQNERHRHPPSPLPESKANLASKVIENVEGRGVEFTEPEALEVPLAQEKQEKTNIRKDKRALAGFKLPGFSITIDTPATAPKPTPAPTPGAKPIVPTPVPTPKPKPKLPARSKEEINQQMYEKDSIQGGIYPVPDMNDLENGDANSMTSNTRVAPAGNVNPGATNSFSASANIRGGGGQRPGFDRVAFMGYKRISALNTDFNLPINRFDRFGSAVANLGHLDCEDKNNIDIAVGAPGDDAYANDGGAVYIIKLDACEYASHSM